MILSGDDRDGQSRAERIREIADFWSAIDCEDACATDGVALDELRFAVTEALVSGDVHEAESLTARAFDLLAGRS